MQKPCYFEATKITFLVLLLLTLAACGPDSNRASENPQLDDSTTPPVENVQQDATHTDRNVPVTNDEPVVAEKIKIADPIQQNGAVTLRSDAPPRPSSVKTNKADTPREPAEQQMTELNAAEQIKSATAPDQLEPNIADPDYPSHGKFDQLLSANVSSSGQVDYKSLKKAEQKLNEYLEILKENHPSKLWDRNRAKAYWLNAYNAFTLKLILDNYPLSKITDLYGGKPWDVKWIELGDKKYSLNNIEHKIIRPTYNDPRIHFAVNCAASSCPPLHNHAFTAAGLNATLNTLTTRFINNPVYNQIGENSAEISKIFEWYGEDFGDLRAFLNEYSTTQLDEKAKISFREYDWTLNGK